MEILAFLFVRSIFKDISKCSKEIDEYLYYTDDFYEYDDIDEIEDF